MINMLLMTTALIVIAIPQCWKRWFPGSWLLPLAIFGAALWQGVMSDAWLMNCVGCTAGAMLLYRASLNLEDWGEGRYKRVARKPAYPTRKKKAARGPVPSTAARASREVA